ncbi:DUF6671 family protein [Gellertiella hungarica]|uniref:DUF6671 domain-containing protein n=1 Tax=Gellertiella hungarica TaxID=1572859 RepID=A0A7W6J5X4_9HYPH|nr:DUF6671 family protein [Gellertiella hungarica]MBB4065381.1 hypothetical protein [Gellertiella hungarica]
MGKGDGLMDRFGTALNRPVYTGETAVLASMHGKEEAFAGPLLDLLGLRLTVAEGIDTDAFGTFAGEIPRRMGMLETAIAKARLALDRSGADIAIASEGSFGPHPHIPFLAAGVELAVLVDERRGIVIQESLIDDQPVYHHAEVTDMGELEAHLVRMDFPRHRLIVRPCLPGARGGATVKAIDDGKTLAEAVKAASAASLDGKAFVQTDMRAHMNPRRMTTLKRLAARLAERAACLCPGCASPGYGAVRMEGGLPCEDCGFPTGQPLHAIFECVACDHREKRPRPGQPEKASSVFCAVCNP